MGDPRKRQRWPPAVASVVVIIAAAIGVTIGMGGFKPVTYQYEPAEIDQVLNLGPWEVAIHDAWVTADDGDDQQTTLTIHATCRNTTNTGDALNSYVDTSLAIRDPVNRLYAEDLTLWVGPWNRALSGADALNPADEPVQCRVVASFARPFDGALAIDVIAMPVVAGVGRWDSVEAAPWEFATTHPYLLHLTAEPSSSN
ncbi:MAG: hypothetical protein LBV06_09695 [Propionibacteriaceae bacterium]|jgi:hypothetical protein|nr:hypothetical protein [Propionibacteriaceae bacterium]